MRLAAALPFFGRDEVLRRAEVLFRVRDFVRREPVRFLRRFPRREELRRTREVPKNKLAMPGIIVPHWLSPLRATSILPVSDFGSVSAFRRARSARICSQ